MKLYNFVLKIQLLYKYKFNYKFYMFCNKYIYFLYRKYYYICMSIEIFIDKIANKIHNYINTYCTINDKDNQKIKYALTCILGELLKFIFLIFIFSIIHTLVFFGVSLIILILIRTFSGGLHFNTFNKCLLFSIIVFIFTSLLAPLLPRLPSLAYYFLGVFSIILIFVESPNPSFKRPIKDKKRRYSLKIISSFLSIFCLIILFFFQNDTSILNCGFFTILIQSFQLKFANTTILSK